MAFSGHCSEASLRDNISRPSRERIRACFDILLVALSGSHSSRVLRLCPEQSSCSCDFGCRRFINKTDALSSSFLIVICKNFGVLVSHNSAGFHQIFQLQTVPEDWKTLGVSNLPRYSSLWIIANCELWWLNIFIGFKLVQPVRLFEPF